MSEHITTDAAAMRQSLEMPFHAEEVKWKAQVVKGNRALAVAYVDARVVMDRLDDVFGIGNWQDKYSVLANGSVVCILSVFVGEYWIEKSDVGSPSEQPDEGDRMKAAFSDSLKRAAVRWGIGRYLYRLPMQWVDYNPTAKQLSKKPSLPEWAIPGSKPVPAQPYQEEPEAEKEAEPIQMTPDLMTRCDDAMTALLAAARQGTASFKAAWNKIDKGTRENLQYGYLEKLMAAKEIATRVNRQAQPA